MTAKPNYGTVGEYDWVNTASGEYDEYPCDGIFNDKTREVPDRNDATCAVGECQSAPTREEGGACASMDSWEDVGDHRHYPGVVIPAFLIFLCIVIVQNRKRRVVR